MAPVRMLPLLAGLALAGCVPGGAPDPAGGAADPVAGAARAPAFGAATREPLDEDPDGRTFRITIAANAPATWAEADAAMMASLDFRCIDGEAFTPMSTVPAIDVVGRDTAQPAGTTFIETYVCAGPFPGEFAIPAGVTTDAARALVMSRLGGDGARVAGRHTIEAMTFNDGHRKYPAIARILGLRMAEAHRACPGGDVVLHRLVVGNFPKPERRQDSTGDVTVLVGVDIECVMAKDEGP